jgi:hypothetical protein
MGAGNKWTAEDRRIQRHKQSDTQTVRQQYYLTSRAHNFPHSRKYYYVSAQRYYPAFWWQQTPWPESASELYRPSDRHLLVPLFADTVCHVVSATDPYGRILDFLDRKRHSPFQEAPQLCSTSWVDPVPDSSENLVAPGVEAGPLDL